MANLGQAEYDRRSRFLAAHGRLAGSIAIGDDFEFSDTEIDALLDEPE